MSMFRGWSCSWHRCFAILVNFNVNPNTLHEETMFVRKKLLESIELTKLIGKRALKDKVESDDDFPLQLYRLKHEVLCKQKLDRAFYRYERLEGRLLLPKYSHRVMCGIFQQKGRFTNAHVQQVMNMLNSCSPDFENVVVRAWTLRERLHRDISMNRRFLDNEGIEVLDVSWQDVLHWGYDE